MVNFEPPAPSGGPLAPTPEEPKPTPKPIAKGTHQPKPTPVDDPVPTTGTGELPGPGQGSGDPTLPGTCTENCGEPTAAVPVCGDGSVGAGEQCDDGNTANGDGCSSTCQIEVKPKPIALVAPTVLQGLRMSGETQLHPSSTTQTLMIRDGAGRVEGIIKVCVATDGSVAAAKLLKSTKYDEYDATLLSAVRDWRYRPYLVNGAPVPACSTVNFTYTIK